MENLENNVISKQIKTLSGLNSNQQLAVKSTEGPVLVIAGAGSGKTSVLTCRVAYLIQELKVDPNRILAITFTNKAADELKERTLKMINSELEWVRTYHSACLKILKEDISTIQNEVRNSHFTVIDELDKTSIIKSIIKEKNISTSVKPKKIIGAISYVKGFDIDLSIHSPVQLQKLLSLPSIIEATNFKTIYKTYQEQLSLNNQLDFDDLINLTHSLLKSNSVIRSKWQKAFDYILIDEFQDTNKKQLDIIFWLTNPDKNNIFAVGDKNQSIYKFRGSYPKVFEDFQQSFKNTKIIKLNINYRSTKNILSASNTLINHNTNSFKNDLVHTNSKNNETIVYIAKNVWQEARWIVKRILEQVKLDDIKYEEIAILYRNNACSRIIEELLIQNGIPYNIYGGINFWQRAEIKDMVSYIKYLYQLSDVACKRILNVPKRAIGDITITSIQNWANSQKITFTEAVKKVNEIETLSASMIQKVQKFTNEMNQLKDIIEKDSKDNIVKNIIDFVKYEEHLQTFELDVSDKMDNLKELEKAIKLFFNENPDGQIVDFLNEVSLYQEGNRKKLKNAINLSTIHAAKGKEWTTVFVYQFNDNLIPSPKCILEDPEGLEEERRIAYVAFTRAKDYLFISCSNEDNFAKRSWGDPATPSRFIDEFNQYRKVDHSRPKRNTWGGWL